MKIPTELWNRARWWEKIIIWAMCLCWDVTDWFAHKILILRVRVMLWRHDRRMRKMGYRGP